MLFENPRFLDSVYFRYVFDIIMCNNLAGTGIAEWSDETHRFTYYGMYKKVNEPLNNKYWEKFRMYSIFYEYD